MRLVPVLGPVDQTQKRWHSEAVGLLGSHGGAGGCSGLQLAEAPLEPLCSEGTAVGLGLPAFRTLLTGE